MSKLLVGCCYLIVACSVRSYEYGYHPSSEEFDGLMREKSWTRDLLWQERNVKRFKPKFSLEKPKVVGFVEHPTIGGSSEKNDKFLGLTNSDLVAVSSESVAEVSKDFSANRTALPIYFTNPATGVVYAITEVGVNTNHTSLPKNGSIPIFVSKEQYERDLYLLQRSYEAKCARQGRPQIIKLDGGSFVESPDSVVVKTEVNVKGNQTRLKRGKKRKNRHRKAKKTKATKTDQIASDSQLDTQLEKPNRVNVQSAFSNSGTKRPPTSSHSNSTVVKIKRTSRPRNSTKVKVHKIAKRSLNSSSIRSSSGKLLTRSHNLTSAMEKPKKILSTQIQVLSEYGEPTVNTRTPKNSIEAASDPSGKPSKTSRPCNKKKSKHPVSEEYGDEYDFGGTSYNDYNSGSDVDDDDDDDSDDEDEDSEESNDLDKNIDGSSEEIAAIPENTIKDYSSIESRPNHKNHKHRPNKASKKRIKRRPSSDDEDYDDYDDDYDNDDGMMGFFRGLFTPVQWVMNRFFDKAGQMFKDDPDTETNDNRKPKHPQYTIYNSAAANGIADPYQEEADEDQGNSIGSWFSSWLGYRRRAGGSTTPAPEEEPGWFDSWFGYDVKTPSPNEEESDPWFFGWFNGKPRPKRTTTTTTTTPVPILTIADPLKNPQKWIGILAQHIINSTSTRSSIVETTTENPDIPRKVSYEKYQIWRLKPKGDSQVRALEEYKRGEEGARMQWLMGPTLRGLTDVLIPPKMLVDFQGTLNFENIAHEILLFDVGKVIAYEQAKQDDILPVKLGPGKAIMSWNRYYDYDSIIKYMEIVQLRNPQYVELIHIGRSYEGRPLVIAKIESKKSTGKLTTTKKKPKLSKKSDQANSVFIEAGIHGREWIGPASATWMINELLRIMKNNRTNLDSEYIKNTTWYIMPVANPDSYEYSHLYDRLWKKTRSRHIAKPNGIINSAMTWLQQKKSKKVCFGVDLDCNWEYNWGRKGSSKSPCNEFFAGPSPFSEPETRAVSKFLMDNRKQIKLFVSLQSYGQIISYPNKVNSSFQSQKLDDLLDVAMVGIDSLRKKGSKARYKVDSTNDLIEPKSGSSDYFATFEVGIPFSYTIHLADNGVHGFLLPSTYIEPTAKDAFEIITAMIDYI